MPKSRDRGDWEEIAAALQPLLDRLQGCPAMTRSEHSEIPADPGLYLFSETGRPLYIGQTRNIRQRLANHTNTSGGENQATFAFLIAERTAKRKKVIVRGTRGERARDPNFRPLFDVAKSRVCPMNVQFASEDDANLRTVFEVYVALTIGTTGYNSFETH